MKGRDTAQDPTPEAVTPQSGGIQKNMNFFSRNEWIVPHIRHPKLGADTRKAKCLVLKTSGDYDHENHRTIKNTDPNPKGLPHKSNCPDIQ